MLNLFPNPLSLGSFLVSCFGQQNVIEVILGFPGKESTCQCRRLRRCRFDPWGQEAPLEEEMATHFSVLAWRILWTEDPGGLQPWGRPNLDLATEHM